MKNMKHVFDKEEQMPDATDDKYSWWRLHESFRDTYAYDDTLSRLTSGIANGETATYMRYSNPDDLRTAYSNFVLTTTGANDIVQRFPEMSTKNTGKSPYSVYLVDGINLMVFVWHR
jgi:hypothetical protein